MYAHTHTSLSHWPIVNRTGEALKVDFGSIRSHLFTFVLILTSPPRLRVDTWQKQSRWVGWTSIFWWLTFLCAIWVCIDFVHWSENCMLLKLSPLFSFYLIYFFHFINPCNIPLLPSTITLTCGDLQKSKYPRPCGWEWGHANSWIWGSCL